MTLSESPPQAGNDTSNPDERNALLITDFTSSSSDLDWYVVNDNVMGGRSEGGFDVGAAELRFAGRTNTRGGGFSSIRSGPLDLDLSAYAGIRVRVQGDGRRYTWRLTTGALVDGREVAYWADFRTDSGDWREVDIPFSSFVPRFRGTELDGPALDTSNITGMGLMIYDQQDGPFELRLDSVHAYAVPFTLDRLRWKKRVLVLSAPRSDDARLRQQLDGIDETRAGFDDRDMLLITLLDDGGSTAGDRPLTKEEAAELRSRLKVHEGTFALRLIGKDGSVKLSDNVVVPLAEIYGLIDGMPMRRQEVRHR